jgi:hypothetical protein
MGGLGGPLQEALDHVAREHQLERLIVLTRHVQQTCADIPELRLKARDVVATYSYVLLQAHACAGFLWGKMWGDQFGVRRKYKSYQRLNAIYLVEPRGIEPLTS